MSIKRIFRAVLIGVIALFASAALIGIMFGTKKSHDNPKSEKTTVVEQQKKDEKPDKETAKKESSETDEAPTEEPTEEAATEEEPVEEEPAEEEQVFETDVAKVTYHDKTEATKGNAVFSFLLENKTDVAVTAAFEDVVVNDEFSVQTLGGTMAAIKPGTKGAVSMVFGYPNQTTLEDMDEIKSLSGEIVVRDDDSFDELGRVPFSALV